MDGVVVCGLVSSVKGLLEALGEGEVLPILLEHALVVKSY